MAGAGRARRRGPVGAWLAGLLAAFSAHAAAPELTPAERRWIRAVAPVVEDARGRGLPVDVVVQPQPTPGLPPLATAFVGGRCKLVLSMRGNAAADATLARLDPALADAALELMAAHELHGHCRRHVDGAWQRLPEGHAAEVPATLAPERHAAFAAMRATRREEGYADLAALAWARQRRPQQFDALRDWLVGERSQGRIPGAHHDTLAWLRRADAAGAALADPAAVASITVLWEAGLSDEP